MANKRDLKKQIKKRTNNLMEDAFSYTLNNPGENDSKADKLIDNIADKWFDLVSKVNHHPKNGKRSEVKKHFTEIKKELHESASKFEEKVDELYKS